MSRPQFGIWFVGARGSVATTATVGLLALRKELTGTTGLISELPHFAHLKLPRWQEFAIGGHDIRECSLTDTAEQLVHQRAISAEVLRECRSELARLERNIRPGTLFHVGARITELASPKLVHLQETPAKAVARIQSDLKEFVQRNRLRELVVVNVASTEPPIDEFALPRRWSELEPMLESSDECPIGASSLYAIAALGLGHPYVNFTPSAGARPKAIGELAELRGTCHAGCDGKTGETLLKSVLAPLMAQRHLHVMSWVGHNIFGNLDGKVLDAAENKASKVLSKDQLLAEILGYAPQTLVSIEYIESLGDWKTAWDHIHFRGFLDTPMTMQFTWQGCDSILAAPLVLDLSRFTLRARQNGERGALTFLASFFKSPIGIREHSFAAQYELLRNWARQVPI